MIERPKSPRSGPGIPLLFSLVTLAIYALTRIGLALWTGPAAVPFAAWPPMLAQGLWFDLAALTTLLAPVLLYEAVLPNRWRASRAHRVLRFTWFTAILFVLLFGAVAEATFWLEFATRFNFIAVDYLLYTHEVIGNIRESYPVPWILTGIALAALAITYALRGWLRRADATPLSRGRRMTYATAAVALPALAMSVASIDQMGRIGNAYADELAGNGLFTFSAAMRRNELDYDRFYATMPQEDADRILAGLGVDRRPLRPPTAPKVVAHESTELHVPGMPAKPRHVVLIMVESLSAEFLGAYGSTKGLTPNLDRFAREGLKFTNAYATGTRTVRGLEAVSVGIPPVPGQSIVHRPDNDRLTTVGGLLEQQGYASSFVYGGYGYFDNMNAYFAGNDYHVVDRVDFPKSTIVFENIWGVADESLFANVMRVIDDNAARGKPSFTHVMTTSNHRPFTYPDGRIDIRSPGGREGGIKYTDWAIGRFIDDARSKPWFDETLFIIVADHCASAAGKTKLPVGGYRIPIIFYAPKLLQPGEFTATMSQIDLAPTILDVLRANGDDDFFGRSVFELPAIAPRAFISNYQELGYLKNGVLTVLSLNRKIQAFRVDPVTFESVPMPIDRTLADEAIAYYQTASRAFRQGALKELASARRTP